MIQAEGVLARARGIALPAVWNCESDFNCKLCDSLRSAFVCLRQTSLILYALWTLLFVIVGTDLTDAQIAVRGQLYIDRNFNGSKDPKEECVFASADEASGCHGTPARPLVVRLTGIDFRGRRVKLSTNAGVDGSFSFSGLNRGAYIICETKPSGFWSYRPCTASIALETNMDLGFTFGNYLDLPVPASDARFYGCWSDDGVGGTDTGILHRIRGPSGDYWDLAAVDPEWVAIARNSFRIHFQATLSGELLDPEHRRFRWSFSDGQSLDTVLPFVEHTYETPGSYTASITRIESETGAVLRAPPVTHVVSVGAAHRFAVDFSFTPSPLDNRNNYPSQFPEAPVFPGSPVTFAATSVGGAPPYVFSWDFDDGSPQTRGTRVSHDYSAPGEYIVTLTAIDSTGSSTSAQHRVGIDFSLGGFAESITTLDFYFRPESLAPNAPPVILEGRVPGPDEKFPQGELPIKQAPSEVAELDTPWSHYTPDKTMDVKPDPGYLHLLSTGVGADGTMSPHPFIEVEWEEALAYQQLRLSLGDPGGWGSIPSWAWPSVGDRVWVEGRWIFDCGHPGFPSDAQGNALTDPAFVNFASEIHPPRALVTFRLNHAVPGDELPRIGCPNGCEPGGSWLPSTGTQTAVSVTQADIFVSGNGGGAADLCSVNTAPYTLNVSVIPPGGVEGVCSVGHTGPIIAVNDRNYVFDVYPPGTTYTGSRLPNGTFLINQPAGARLQWRIIHRPITRRSCGTSQTDCQSVEPLLCPIDAATPPPDQGERTCPVAPAEPTRLRVILPFRGTNANVFAASIVVGWDQVSDYSCPADIPIVPASSEQQARTTCTPIRTFEVRLHEFRVLEQGLVDAPWLVFVDVGGQWRFLSKTPFEQDADCHPLSLRFPETLLVGLRRRSCYRFDAHPWTVSIQDGTPIHVALGGFLMVIPMDRYCRNTDIRSGCDPSLTFTDKIACAPPPLSNTTDKCKVGIRIGTHEFDLNVPYYAAPDTIDVEIGRQRESLGVHYQATFTVREITPEPLLSATGKVSFLRVHDMGTGFGTLSDTLDVDVVIGLDSHPGKAFGFRLRTGEGEDDHRGMLDLLRSAFRENKTVRIDYRRRFRNGTITRVEKLD